MRDIKSVRFSAELQRKDPRLPTYFIVRGSDAALLGVTSTSVVEVVANGHELGRRTIKAWGKGVDDWFVELSAPLMKSAALQVGDSMEVELRPADTSLPAELKREFDQNAGLEEMWSKLTDRERREGCEHIRSAKNQQTRERRASVIATNLSLRSRK